MSISISLGTKFRLKPKTFMFLIKFIQIEYFHSKVEKSDITINFCIFELVLVPNLSLNSQYCVFGPNLPKQGISGRK